MTTFILGVFLGVFLMFFARIADKDLTRVVERYKQSGSLIAKKPIIVTMDENRTEQEIEKILLEQMERDSDAMIS
jgi:hypothetical protein